LKWHFAPTAACLFITFTFGGNACMGCCSCLPFFFAGEDKIGGESSVRMLLLVLASYRNKFHGVFQRWGNNVGWLQQTA